MNYSKELASLAKIATLNDLEFRVQFIAVLGCVTTAVAATGLWILAIWFILHYVLVYTERTLSLRYADYRSSSAFFTIIGLNLGNI